MAIRAAVGEVGASGAVVGAVDVVEEAVEVRGTTKRTGIAARRWRGRRSRSMAVGGKGVVGPGVVGSVRRRRCMTWMASR